MCVSKQVEFDRLHQLLKLIDRKITLHHGDNIKCQFCEGLVLECDAHANYRVPDERVYCSKECADLDVEYNYN